MFQKYIEYKTVFLSLIIILFCELYTFYDSLVLLNDNLCPDILHSQIVHPVWSMANDNQLKVVIRSRWIRKINMIYNEPLSSKKNTL